MKKKLLLILVYPFFCFSAEEHPSEYSFDPSLFKGGNLDLKAIEALSKPGVVPPGEYKLDIYVNQAYIGKYNISYLSNNENSIPCFPSTLISQIDFKDEENIMANKNNQCFFLSDISKSITSKTELSTLKLYLSVPQSLLNIKPRGYVNPDDYDAGENIGFVNYLANYNHASYSSQSNVDFNSGWLSLNGGLNIGDWQYRQVSNLNWDENQGYKWSNISSYIQHPIIAIGSNFKAGQLVTNGNFFSGMNYNGISLSTEESMLPDSARGYAPIVRGIALSNAKVVISQNGNKIYQTTVSPGSFEISDLYPTSYSGDLQVQVIESNGETKTFLVPFSASYGSIRPGMSKYNISAGSTTERHSLFADINYQRGITNSITLSGGTRIAEDYLSAALGGVYANSFGAFSLNANISQAKLTKGETEKGWMTELAWNKSFVQTGSNISVSNYFYSTRGYLTLSDFLAIKNNNESINDWLIYSGQARSRFNVNLSQSLSSSSNIFLSGIIQFYNSGRSKDTQLQVGYGHQFSNSISMNISLSRQYTGSYDDTKKMETSLGVSFSIPLFSNSPRQVSLSASYNYNKNSGGQSQISASGVLDDENTTNYSLNTSHNSQNKLNTFSGSLQKRFSDVDVGINASMGKNYWQVSGNAHGAFAIHSGGITFGPYLGNTFGLIEAKGAEGASLFTGSQTKIDSNGYALVSSMNPYQYNTVSINPLGMSGNVELLDNQKRVAPVGGSAVKVKFKTKAGYPLLIKAVTDSKESIPMGTPVYDLNNQPVGITGQSGQIYVRVEKPEGTLIAKWGSNNEYCSLPYKIEKSDLNKQLINMTVSCNTVSKGI